jgi:hypothetical protein
MAKYLWLENPPQRAKEETLEFNELRAKVKRSRSVEYAIGQLVRGH